MNDYAELVKSLRDGADFLENSEQEVPKNSFATMCRNAADVIEELADTNVGKWVSTKERLPEKHKWVLVVGDNLYDMDFISSRGDWTIHTAPFVYVKYWMPVPDAPVEERE